MAEPGGTPRSRLTAAWGRLTREWPVGLLVLVAVAAVVRLALAYTWGRHGVAPFDGDSSSYIEPARALLADHRFIHRDASPEPMFLRTPGYPVFLAALMSVVGRDPVAWSMAQAALSALVGLGVFSTARRLFGTRAAWIGTVIVLVDPLSTASSTVIMTETLQGLLIVAGVLGLVVATEGKGRWWPGWLLAGVSFALATLVRPSTYYLVAALAVFAIAFLIHRRSGVLRGARVLLLLVLPSVLLVGGWQVRNQVQVDSWRFAGIEAVNMYYFRAGGVLAAEQGVPFDPYSGLIDYRLTPRAPGETQGAYANRMLAEALPIIRARPDLVAKDAVAGLARTLLGEGGDALRRAGVDPSPLAIWGLRGWIALLWVLALVGAVAAYARRWRRWGVSAAVLVVGYVLVVSAGPEAYSRFRVPIVPLVAVLAGGGCALVVWAAGRRRAARGTVSAAPSEPWRP